MPILAAKRGGRLSYPQGELIIRSWRVSEGVNQKGEDAAYRVSPQVRVVLCFLLILLELQEPVLYVVNY